MPFPDFVGRRAGSMWGTTPPCEMTTSPRSLLNSSSFLEIKYKYRLRRGEAREQKHTGQRVASDGVQYDASCYHELRCLRVRESQQQGIREQQRGKLSNLNQTPMIKRLQSSDPLTRCTGSNTLSVIALLQETVDTTDGELETSFR